MWVVTNVSEELATSIFRAELYPETQYINT
jgi:hypothetical protein